MSDLILNLKYCKECKEWYIKNHSCSSNSSINCTKPSYSCQICGKNFTRKDNRNRHEKQHSHNKNTFQCSDCKKIFFHKSSLTKHKKNHHQSSSFSPQPSSSSHQPQHSHLDPQPSTSSYQPHHSSFNPQPTTSSHQYQQIDDNLFISQISNVFSKKFNTSVKTFQIKITENLLVDNPPPISIPEVYSAIEKIFNSILSHIIPKSATKHDLIKIVIQAANLDYPIIIPFTPIKHISVNLILSEIERVLQSFEEFLIDERFFINISHIKYPIGAKKHGKYRNSINFQNFLKHKRCIIQIKNKDDMCCARAIITGIAKLEKNPIYLAYKNPSKTKRSFQTRDAQLLHKKADVPIQPCGIKEIDKFQKYLQPKYQILVVSKDHFNAVIYSGKKISKKKIILYLHDNHYDLITSMPAFMERSYYCFICNKGYNNKYHRCVSSCNACFSTCDSNQPYNWKYCNNCNRSFKGSKCFLLHVQQSKISGEST